jgi:DNA-binding FadR family transcriptional regulator
MVQVETMLRHHRSQLKEQLLSQLLGAMRTGRLKSRRQALNERDLAEFSTLSRSTVRDVLNTLEKQGAARTASDAVLSDRPSRA